MFYPHNNLATATEKVVLQFRNENLDDPQLFVDDILELVELCGYDEIKSKWVFKTALKEEAEAWYRSCSKGLAFGELIEEFRKRFIRNTLLKVNIDRISEMKYEGGSLLYYLDRMYGYAKRGGIPEDILLAFVIKGVPRQIADTIIINAKDGLSWKQLYAICERMQISRPQDELKESLINESSVNRISDVKNYKKKQARCFLCGKLGHIVRNCFKNPNNYNKKVNNYYKEKDVREVYVQDKAEEDFECSMEGNKSFKSYRILSAGGKKFAPWIDAFICDTSIKFKCLIDSGADINLIRPELILDHSNIKSCKMDVRTANNEKMSVRGICKMSIMIKGKKIVGEFVITDEINSDCIIGLPILNEYGLILSFGKIFECSFKEKINNRLGQHRIITKVETPVMAPLYRLGSEKEKLASEFIEKYLEEGIIRPSKSPWRSPVTIAPKKGGKGRFCIDYRRLNDVTVRDAYPMPRVEELIGALNGACYFSKMDAESGYHQIDMDPADIEKTAFACREGLFEFVKMPFGLVNAPATFQRIMNRILKPFLYKFVIVYMDDILIYSKTWQDHKRHVEQVKERLNSVGLKLNLEKCEYGKKEIKILGHTISEGCVKIDQDKVKAIKELPLPCNKRKLQSFLGLFNYCSKHVKQSYMLLKGLYDILKLKDKDEDMFWKTYSSNHKYVKMIEACKDALEKAAILTIPDLNKQFILTTDASVDGIGAVLSQVVNGEERIISFYSCLNNPAERRYSTTEQELLAVMKAIQHFREYLIINRFVLRTDHKALTYLFKSRNMKARLARWSLLLQEYDFEIRYIKGDENFSDHLSRDFEKVHVVQKIGNRKKLTEERGRQMLVYYHDLLGHGSVNNLRYVILGKYEWKNCNRDIENFVKNCTICQRERPILEEKDNIAIISKARGEIWELDIVGPFKESDSGFRYILTMIDHYTKISEVAPLYTKDMSSIVSLIENRICKKYGVPKMILTDNGKEFKNWLCREFAERKGIIWKYGSPYNPTTTGLVERFNKTLISKLRKITEFGKYDWEKCLNKANRAYLYSYHRAIGCAPIELYKGEIRTDMDRQEKLGCGLSCEYFQGNLRKHMDVYKKSYDKAINGGKRKEFKIGDIVWYKNISSMVDKLSPKWAYRGKIVEKKFDSYGIILENGRKIIANKKHLKRFFC